MSKEITLEKFVELELSSLVPNSVSTSAQSIVQIHANSFRTLMWRNERKSSVFYYQNLSCITNTKERVIVITDEYGVEKGQWIFA